MPEQIDSIPLVSVIIIFFNAKKENFFEEAIESIFAQTYDNWELVLADDGSTDESCAIAQQYAEQYPQKVRYVEHEGHQNRGMSATRNLGIRHAKGEYIAFLDADDVWLPHKLEQQVPLLAAHPEAAMLYGRTQYWFSWTKSHHPALNVLGSGDTLSDYLTVTSREFDRVIQPPSQLLLLLHDPQIHPCTCSVLIRRQMFEQLGGFEERFRNANEDMVFHSKVFLKFPIYVSSKCWDRYRRHPDSYWGSMIIQGKDKESAYIGRSSYLAWLNAYLLQQQIQDPELLKVLRQAMFECEYPRLNRALDRLRHPLRSTKNLLKKLGKEVPMLRLSRE